MKYIASFSGGKDSVATIILAKEHGEPLDEIVFSEVMYDENISGELPEHIDFIENTAFPLFESWGYRTKIVHSNKTYIDCFNHVIKRSKHEERIGKKAGFPMAGKCVINRDCKVKPIQEYMKMYDPVEVIQYIGIAIDEPHRLDRLGQGKVSLLAKYGYTERMAKEKAEKYGLLSPCYNYSRRGGCWFCPNCGEKELRNLRNNHGKLWNKLLKLEEEKDIIGNMWNTRKKIKIRDMEEKFCFEDAQLNIDEFLVA